VNKILKKISILVSITFFLGLSAYSDDLFMPLVDKADKAKIEFQDLYKYIMDQGGFAQSPDERFDLDSNITGHILDNGPVLLSLIDWLDKNKQDDAIGLLLLRKLNRYLYLEFRHFVGQLKVNKKYEGKLVGLLHDFYKFKVPAKIGTVEEKLKFSYPFQAALSKAMVFILIVNGSYLGYDEKVENIAYYLDKIRRELIGIKNSHENCTLRTTDVNDFIELLQTYATKEPLLGPNYMKRILVTVAVIAVIALVVWLAWDNVVRESIKTKIGHGWNFCGDKLGELIEKLGGRLAKGACGQTGIENLLARYLNQLHESGARIVPGFPIVPNPVNVPNSNTPATTTQEGSMPAPVPAPAPQGKWAQFKGYFATWE